MSVLDGDMDELFREVAATDEGRRLLVDAVRTHLSKTFVGQLIERINALKAGRSLNHQTMRQALERYCNGLSVDDKAVVMKVVKELVRVSQTDPNELYEK
jgi:hypothetical protein